jgi:hypothetical protein
MHNTHDSHDTHNTDDSLKHGSEHGSEHKALEQNMRIADGTEDAEEGLRNRNWELELLISGAVFFSLFQLPSLFQSMYEDAFIQGGVTAIAFLYAKAVSYVLIANLGGHFILRGYWVGLMGLASVFPQGIIWEKLKLGTEQREFLKRRIDSLTNLAASVDGICRMIFGFTFMLLLLMVGGSVVYGVAGVVSLMVSALLPSVPMLTIGAVVTTILLLPIFAVAIYTTLTKRPAFKPSARLHDVMMRLMAYGHTITLGQLHAPILYTLNSNITRWKMTTIFLAFYCVLVFAPLAEMLLHNDRAIFFPDEDSPFTMESAFYENFRSQEGSAVDRALFRYPSIQSDVITDKYIRLFLPYRTSDNDSIRAAAAKQTTNQSTQQSTNATSSVFSGFHREGWYVKVLTGNDSLQNTALNAVASMYSVRLNDSLLHPRYFFQRHPASNLPGIVTYIPSAGLPEGLNILVVERFGSKPTKFVIPFQM